MNKPLSETTINELALRVERLGVAYQRHAQVRKPVMLRNADGKAIGVKPRTHEQLYDDFWSRVSIGGIDQCWPWIFGRTEKGYGYVSMNGKRMRAHVAALLFSGRIPTPGKFGCHHCDNPPCCNPWHLFFGSPKENTADMLRRGRDNHVHGECSKSSKLTNAMVVNIRSRFKSGCKINGLRPLSREFGIQRAWIKEIIQGRAWKHVPMCPP